MLDAEQRTTGSSRVESASESVSLATLGRRTPPPIPRPGGTIDPGIAFIARLNSHAHATVTLPALLWVTACFVSGNPRCVDDDYPDLVARTI